MAQDPDFDIDPDFTQEEDSDFVPDPDFVPEMNPSPLSSGRFVTKGRTTQWEADQPVDISKRPDRGLFRIGSEGAPERFWDITRDKLINRIALNESIPEWFKPGLARYASMATEPFRLITEIVANPQPEDVLLPSLIRPRARIATPTPIPTKPQLLLPEGRGPGLETDPFIASETGRIQKQSLLNPQEEARLAGYDTSFETGPIGFPSTEIKPAVDLSELRERNRLEDIFYTQHEQAGGTSLAIPDRPFIDSPPVAGETGLGFESVSRADLPYPLNIAPEAVRPRSAQEVTRALAGDEFAKPPVVTEPITFESPKIAPENPIPPTRDMRGGTAAITPDDIIVASAVRNTRSKVKADTGLDVASPTVRKAVTDAPPPIKDGVASFVTSAESGKPSILWKSVYTQLSDLGPAGKQLVQKFQRAAQNRAEYDAVWTEPLFKAGARLKRNEFDNFGSFVEGRMPILNERVQKAVDAWRAAQNAMGDTAISTGLHLKRGDTVIPFEKISGEYWPHVPKESLTKKDIIDKLVDNGMSRHEATIVAKRWEATGEIFLRGQHSRLEASFAYRDDFDVAVAHGRAMSKRIANHQNLGPKDIAGQGLDGVANLIEDTTDPDLALKLAKRLAGRDELPSERLIKGLNQARKWASLTSLPNFTIPNVILGQSTNAYMALVSRHPIAAAKEIKKLFSSAYRDEIRASGVFNSFNRSMLEELSGVDPFQIGAGEKINRSVAAAIGRAIVKEAFTDYKAGVNVNGSRYFLETLLARNPDEIAAITPELERFAGGRMAEITQGLNNPGNLPYGWSNPVNSYGNLATQLFIIFKKVGFQVTKTVKDTIKADPAVAIPLWLATTQIAGEMVGDIKSAITGKERPEELAIRIGDNWGNAFMLGLPWELATSAQYGPTSAIASAAGPIASKASELGYASWRTGERILEGQEDPLGPLRRLGIRNIPIPGRERLREDE